ncbi:MAG: hypothetical protein VXV96_13885 [Bdellovibrionota bacterium]|nr:hypothetical protein [Bdellovibrionota bacterium]
MVKAYALLFFLLSFLTTQVLAKTCEVHCELSKKEEVTQKKMASGHECCDKKKKKEGKTSPFKCQGELTGQCSPESFLSEFDTSLEKNFSLIGHTQLPLNFQRLGLSQQHYRPKIPDDSHHNFLHFKSQQRLFILKDQFLI